MLMKLTSMLSSSDNHRGGGIIIFLMMAPYHKIRLSLHKEQIQVPPSLLINVMAIMLSIWSCIMLSGLANFNKVNLAALSSRGLSIYYVISDNGGLQKITYS